MNDDFNFIGVEDDAEDNGEPETLGLVVGAVATNSAELLLRERMHRHDGAAAALVLFIEDDESSNETLMNADAFMVAMGGDWLPTIAEASAWKQAEMAASFERWRDKLARAQGAGPDMPPTGKPRAAIDDRGGTRNG